MSRLRCVFIAAMLSLGAMALSSHGQAGPYQVELTSDPVVLPVGKANLDVFVTDSMGRPIDGAQIRAIAQMPNMPMGEHEQDAIATEAPGHYRFVQSFSMEGGYEARISVAGPLGRGTALIPIETGQSTAAKGAEAGRAQSFWPWLVGLAAIAFLAYRIRRTGQSLNPKAVLNKAVISSLVLLGIVVTGAVYAVNHLRRTGAMTPIEAQTMNMDMPPPEGVTPVTLALAKSELLNPTVQYTGQAVGYDEIEVAARTTGVVLWMPSYLGSVVRKGDVVARLDTSQLTPQVQQQKAMADSAQQGVGVAQAESRQADAMIHQAESELGQFQGAVEEAKADLVAAQADKRAADAEVVAANADLGDSSAKAAAAHADQRYWADEIKRETALFSNGAVSKDEFQKEQAEAAKSDAAGQQADEIIESSKAKLEAAKARVARAAAMISAARHKIDQADSALMSHHAHVMTAEAEKAASEQKINQAKSGVRQADAALSGTVAQQNYAAIRAESDGVVTSRTISPGSLVAPGQVLLRIASIRPIRLQANVPQAELAKIQIGESVQVTRGGEGGKPISAKVTSISPNVDPVSRIGVVEALYANTDHAFGPGQFVTMTLPIGRSSKSLVVPSSAIQATAASGDEIQAQESSDYVWVATAVSGQSGRFTVSRRAVRLGPSSGDRATVLSGLQQGDQVVAEGATGLVEGQPVSASPAQERIPKTPGVAITESGFVPETIVLPAGTRQVIFLRKTDNTCAKEVVFADLKLRHKLPLNQPVTIDLPKVASGELHYACGMNMLKGSVVVR